VSGTLLAAARMLAALALATWCGGALLAWLDPVARDGGRLAVRAALAFAVGLGAVTAVMLALALCGLPFTALTVGGGLLLAGALGRWRARATARGAGAARDAGAARAAARDGVPARAPGFAFAVALLLVVGALGAWSVHAGATFVDAHSVWLLRAKAIAVDGGLDGAWTQRWIDAHDRRGYPPLVSFAGAWLHLAAGRVDDGAVKLLWAGALAALLLLLHDLLRDRLGGGTAALAALLFAATPFAISGTVWGTADLPLALFLLVAAHGLLRWLAEPDGRTGLGEAAAGLLCAALTKNEGLVAVALFPLAALLCRALAAPPTTWERRRRTWPVLALLIVPALLLAAAWWWLAMRRGLPVLALPPPGGAPELLPGARAALVAARVGRELVGSAWLYAWPLAAVAAALAARRVRRARAAGAAPDAASIAALFAATVAFGQLAACGVALATHRGDLALLLQTTLPRLPGHVLPLAMAAALIALAGSAPRAAPAGAPPATPPAAAPGHRDAAPDTASR
jgi:hypothetical protein